ncbi:unnamed protein product [Malus baccata var. baccata]
MYTALSKSQKRRCQCIDCLARRQAAQPVSATKWQPKETAGSGDDRPTSTIMAELQGQKETNRDFETTIEATEKRIKLLLQPGEMKARFEQFKKEAESQLPPLPLKEPLIRDLDKFEWCEEHRAAFMQIKVTLATLPVLVPPRRDKPLKLYISAAEESIGCLLAQDADIGREQAIFYLSRHLNPPEINYSPVEKLCLALFFAASKLRHYILPFVTQAEYEALVIGLSVFHDLYAARVLIFGDLELVINQLNRTFRCMSCTLVPYHMVASYLAESFDGIMFNHVSRGRNTVVDELTQIASGAQLLGARVDH